MPAPGKFVDHVRGTYHGQVGDDRYAPDFYEIYGKRIQRQVAVPEAAALYIPGRPVASALEIEPGMVAAGVRREHAPGRCRGCG